MLPCSVLGLCAVGVSVALMVCPTFLNVMEMLQTMTVPYAVHRIMRMHVQHQQTGTCPCPAEAKTGARARFHKDAVVVLALKERMGFLNDTLRLFYRNFNRCFRKDLLIFHNGDFTAEDQQQMRAELGPELQFHELAAGSRWWGPPDSMKDHMHKVDSGHWPIGFFHMTRWYGVLIYEYLHLKGYEWFMRMDDDSYFLSCIDYDLFGRAEARGALYAYRMEHVDAGTGPITDIVQQAMDEWGLPITPMLLEHFEGGRFQSDKWDGRHYYNNFCLTKISFWTSPRVRHLFMLLEESGFQYTRRVLDAPLQTMMVQLFVPEEKILHFDDWSYFHHPKMVLVLYSLLPSAVISVVEWLGIPNFEVFLGLREGKDIRFFLDVQKVFGRGSRWYRALRR